MSRPLRVGYVPYDAGLCRPGDRRRFVHYARARGIPFEIADPAKAYDAVVVTEAGDLSVWSRYRGGKVVYDLVDAYLAIPRTDVKGLLRGLAKFAAGQSRRLIPNHWEAVRRMCRRADAVACGSPEQAEFILPFCRNVHPVLDFHGMYDRVKADHAAGPVFKLAWEGLPHNLASFRGIGDALRSVGRRHRLELHVATALRSKRFLGHFGEARAEDLAKVVTAPVVLHAWEEATAAAIMTACDLAVVPISLDDPFYALKPENKLLIFWRMGLPALVSATPSYLRAMKGADLDMACRDADEWGEKLERYVSDDGARCEAARKGLAYARAHGDEEMLLARWDGLFSSIGFGG